MTAEMPNIVLLVVDCFRRDAAPLEGPTDLVFWPKVRARSTAFSQAISTATNTPVCFTSLLSGQYSFRHGVRTIAGPRINPGVETLATVLRPLGYRTSAYFTGPMLEAFGINEGFDTYEHRPPEANIHSDWGRKFIDGFARHFEGDGPALVLAHFFELHAKRATNGVRVKHNTMAEYRVAWQQLDLKLDALLDRMPENTLLVLTGDHSEQIGRMADRTPWGHLHRKIRENLNRPRRPVDWKGHGFHVLDKLMRIPLTLAGPGVPEGKIVDDQVRQIDVAPTLLDLIGRAFPAPTHGRSLAPLMRGESLPHEAAYLESGRNDALRHWHGLRKDGWKYIEHPRSGLNAELKPQLYDLSADPNEKRNVIKQNLERAVAMRQEIDRLIYSAGEIPSEGTAMSEEDLASLDEQLRALGYI